MEENLENINKNNKIKIIFAFIATFIVFYICFFYVIQIAPSKYNTWSTIYSTNKIDYFYQTYLFFKFLICFLLYYLPTIFLLKYIFKKTENTKKRMWSVALAVPLTTLFYGIIHVFVSRLPIYNPELWYDLWLTNWFYMWTIGANALHFQILLFCFLPSVILTSLIIPKKYLPIKGEICKTALLTYAMCIMPFIIFLILFLKFI